MQFPYTELVTVTRDEAKTTPDWRVALEKVAAKFDRPMRLDVLTPMYDQGNSTLIRVLVFGPKES